MFADDTYLFTHIPVLDEGKGERVSLYHHIDEHPMLSVI